MSRRAALEKLLSGFAGKSVLSLLVKLSAGILSYVFLLVAARVLGPVEFGVFAFTLSAANFMALVGGLGQPNLMLRNLSFTLSEDRPAESAGLVRFAFRITWIGILGAGAACFIVLVGLSQAGVAPGTIASALAGVLLIAALTQAELQACIMRVFGAAALALLPRDVLWRVLAAVFLLGLGAMVAVPTAAQGLALSALALGLLVVGQTVLTWRMIPKAIREATPATGQKSGWWQSSRSFLGIAAANGLSQHLTVVAVGLTAAPADVGAFFAAYRTASLLSLPLMGANIVIAPLIARHYKDDRLELAQNMIRQFILLAAAPTLLGLLIILFWGDGLLALFDESYAAAHLAMVIFAVGFLINTLTGPCGFVMMMTRGEKTYLRYTVIFNVLAVVGSGIASAFGMTLAAAAIVVFRTMQTLAASRWSRVHLGLETTLLAIRRTPPAPPADTPTS